MVFSRRWRPGHQPAQGQVPARFSLTSTGDLVGRTADTAALHPEGQPDVVERTLERDDRIVPVFSRVCSRAPDPLGGRLLAVGEDLVHQLGDQRRTVDRIVDQGRGRRSLYVA